MKTVNKYEITKDGFYGNFGGQILSDELKKEYSKIAEEFLNIKDNPEFVAELDELLKSFAGRPSPVYYARNLSKKYDFFVKSISFCSNSSCGSGFATAMRLFDFDSGIFPSNSAEEF